MPFDSRVVVPAILHFQGKNTKALALGVPSTPIQQEHMCNQQHSISISSSNTHFNNNHINSSQFISSAMNHLDSYNHSRMSATTPLARNDSSAHQPVNEMVHDAFLETLLDVHFGAGFTSKIAAKDIPFGHNNDNNARSVLVSRDKSSQPVSLVANSSFLPNIELGHQHGIGIAQSNAGTATQRTFTSVHGSQQVSIGNGGGITCAFRNTSIGTWQGYNTPDSLHDSDSSVSSQGGISQKTPARSILRSCLKNISISASAFASGAPPSQKNCVRFDMQPQFMMLKRNRVIAPPKERGEETRKAAYQRARKEVRDDKTFRAESMHKKLSAFNYILHAAFPVPSRKNESVAGHNHNAHQHANPRSTKGKGYVIRKRLIGKDSSLRAKECEANKRQYGKHPEFALMAKDTQSSRIMRVVRWKCHYLELEEWFPIKMKDTRSKDNGGDGGKENCRLET